MSQSNVEKVRNLVIKDPEMQKRLEATQGENAFMEALIEIGADKGLPFTAADVDAWKSGEGASVELNEERLKMVAGGRASSYARYGTSYGNSILCAFCSHGSWM